MNGLMDGYNHSDERPSAQMESGMTKKITIESLEALLLETGKSLENF